MTGALSRRNLFKIGGAAAAAGIGVAVPREALAQEGTWYSALVQEDADGRLRYPADPVSDKRIPDFSWAGYRNGEEAIPDVPVVKTIGPLADPEQDATAHLQAALDEVGALPKDPVTGFRGALLLLPGVYPVATTVWMTRSGVVLRGSGRQLDTGTVIRSTAAKGNLEDPENGVECPLWVGGKAKGWEDGLETAVKTEVVADLVKAGTRRLTMASTEPFKVGDNVIVHHPCTQEWLDEIDGGGGEPWQPDSLPIVYNRYIKKIEGDVIVLDAPVFNDLDRSLSQTFVYVWDQDGLVRNLGVESLRVDMTAGDRFQQDEAHADSCIAVVRTEDSWIRDVAALHFAHAGVIVRRSTRVTVRDVRARDPRSQIIGKRRYNFNAGYMAQLILFENLWASEARHAFVSGGQATSSGNVWVDCRSDFGHAESGGHAKWSQGLLYDNVQELSSQSPNPWILNLHNRETAGESDEQGWSSVYSVLWNCTVNRIDDASWACVQRPPTSQNFAIATTGIANNVNWYTGNPAGYIEANKGPGLVPASLYRAQLDQRVRFGMLDF
ncbi:peptidoglycan-binding protein [Glycomyces sp. NPDC048151]|uniref:peptidoglycan-binding protein n=1 Tax=Glycomyces sp. NPDC048151 TaxID=3364002 RepID=UPI00371D3EA5